MPVSVRYSLDARVTEFTLPLAADAFVVGRQSPVSCAVLDDALRVLSGNAYQVLPLDDDRIACVIVRRKLLRRVSEQRLLEFVRQDARPLMTAEEVLKLELAVELRVDDVTD